MRYFVKWETIIILKSATGKFLRFEIINSSGNDIEFWMALLCTW